MNKFILFLLTLGFIAIKGNAQLKYHSNGELTFGDATSYHHYTIRGEAKGLYFNYQNKFLEFNVSVLNPRIAGTGDEVVFYNSLTSTFNSIQVANVYNHSDRRSKKNIEALTKNHGLEAVMKLNPISFDWKKTPASQGFSSDGKPKRSLGFIAQDVSRVLPELVKTGTNDEKVMNYIGLIPVLTKSIQELNKKVEALEKEVERLKTTNQKQ